MLVTLTSFPMPWLDWAPSLLDFHSRPCLLISSKGVLVNYWVADDKPYPRDPFQLIFSKHYHLTVVTLSFLYTEKHISYLVKKVTWQEIHRTEEYEKPHHGDGISKIQTVWRLSTYFLQQINFKERKDRNGET